MKRDSPSPLLDPQPQPRACAPMQHSDSSAMYSDTSRSSGLAVVLEKVAST